MQSLVSFLIRALSRPATVHERRIADVVIARRRLFRMLAVGAKLDGNIVSQAQARAERLIHAGVERDEAVRRVRAWAFSAIHGTPKAA
jgi:hypothetical protein